MIDPRIPPLLTRLDHVAPDTAARALRAEALEQGGLWIDPPAQAAEAMADGRPAPRPVSHFCEVQLFEIVGRGLTMAEAASDWIRAACTQWRAFQREAGVQGMQAAVAEHLHRMTLTLAAKYSRAYHEVQVAAALHLVAALHDIDLDAAGDLFDAALDLQVEGIASRDADGALQRQLIAAADRLAASPPGEAA